MNRLQVLAPGGMTGVQRWNRAYAAMVAEHGSGDCRNGAPIVPDQGLSALVDSPANRAVVLARRCRCQVCEELLETPRPVLA